MHCLINVHDDATIYDTYLSSFLPESDYVTTLRSGLCYLKSVYCLSRL